MNACGKWEFANPQELHKLRNIQIAAFCKDFNEKTESLKAGYPTPTTISINVMSSFIRRLIENFLSGKITLKHVYEIALVQAKDPFLRGHSLQSICRTVVKEALSVGISVVDHIDPTEYKDFLHGQEIEYQQYLVQLQQKRIGIK
ncbi:39S ribosomal protein L11, mitochondrial-like [Octopus sinensis]|uniref:Large ribosomal subunit protein uL11m n=1 Tax=Octopus sinensis TaxID=2607531 RepID=A0A6P7TXQ9_9MOLL|nr:39S ribosomal protein L11, mitochondrial-like [Octopus sinensis]